MYHTLLTNRYLTSRVIPLIAVAAVALCVALVIIVVSVMTGFLDMVKNSGRTLMGDVVVSYAITGLPHYEKLIEEIEALPEAAAATPVVDGFGLLKMPYPTGDRKQIEEVQVWGIEPASFGEVTGYFDTLYWRTPGDDALEAMGENDFRRRLLNEAGRERLDTAFERGRALADETGDDGYITLGIHVSIGNERQRDGSYRPVFGPLGPWWMPMYDVVLTLVPMAGGGTALDPESRALRVANEFLSGVFLIDEHRVMIPLQVAQEMLHLDGAVVVDDDGEETGEVEPARATMVLVRAADGVSPDELSVQVEGAYDRYLEALRADASVSRASLPPARGGPMVIQTWRQQQRQFIDPIEKERELMRVLFSIIYLVCGGLVLAIFWAIVYEKTRDIGILRSVGASRVGIALIFIRYGAIIGLVGAVLGLGLAYLVVVNINEIHNAMGEQAPMAVWIAGFVAAAAALTMAVVRGFGDLLLPVVLWSLCAITLGGLAVGLMLHRGTLIWDPKVYYFARIPNDVDVVTAVTTMIGAVIFSVLGAVVPATRAADTDPVRALRYE